MSTVWVGVRVESPQGIRAVHYHEVSDRAVYPCERAASLERAQGNRVLGAYLFSDQGGAARDKTYHD